ncbi:MAG: glycosyltransferase family 2 protein [Nocardioides sp.]
MSTKPTDAGGAERVAVVIVTYNRAELLPRTLDGLAAQTRPPDSVIVIDNASTDGTAALLAARADLPLQVVRQAENTGGAGGFHAGTKLAFEQGFDRIWLMDDDIVPAPDCLEVLLRHDLPALMVVREDRHGALMELSATEFDLRTPWRGKPKRASIASSYANRADLPELVPLDVVAFEGFLIQRRVIEAVGLPNPAFFIFYDDADLALRIRRAGFAIYAVRDAVMVRQLDFDQQHDLGSWKGRFMYRNLFLVHFRHGENALVRAKPFAVAAAVVALSPVRGGRSEARNVIRAIREAQRMRAMPDPDPPRG